MQSLKNSALLPIGIIVLILVASGIAIFTIRGGSDDNIDVTNNPTDTATPTDEVADTSEPTEEASVTPSEETSPTPTTSATPTPTSAPTTDGSLPAITDTLNTNWAASVTSQTVSGQTYFIVDRELKKGSSASDSNATRVYKSPNGNIKSFYAVSNNVIYIAEGRNPGNNQSRLVKYTVSANKATLIYGYEAVRAEVNSFLVNTKNNTEFFLTYSTVDGSLAPMVAYEKSYNIQWSKTISGTAKSDVAWLRGVVSDGSKLIITITDKNGQSQNVDYNL